MLPDAKLVDSELQITAESPIGGCGVYDLYPGIYLGRDVWCKKLSYGDPDGKAMMVRASFYRLVLSSSTTPPEVQAGDGYLEQAVEEGPRAASLGKHSPSGVTSVWLLHAIRGSIVSLQRYPA